MKRLTLVALALMAMACSSTNRSMSMSNQDIVETAMSAGMFNTLASALRAADLVDTLKGTGPYTVFAPTDEAFAKIPASTLQMLMRPENKDKLRSILMYHVVPGRSDSKAVMGMNSATTAGGQNVSIMMMGDRVMVGNAHIVKADVMASNGVIHVIDTVLMPPGM